MLTTILTTAIITGAFFAESIFGFGGGLISIPLLSHLLGVKDAVTLTLIFQALMGLLIIKNHQHTNWKVAFPMTIGLIFGTILGTYSLAVISESFLRRFLAISILGFLIKMLFFKGFNFGEHYQKSWGGFTGAVGGWFQGIIGTGGPIFTMYLSVVLPQKAIFRATLIYLFFTTSIIRVITSVSTGLLNQDIIRLTLPIFPIFLVAIFLGQHIHHKIDERYYQYAVQIILFLAAISMLLR